MYAEINYIVALLSAVFIIVILYGPWQSVITDWARQDLFEIRDRVFDMAAAGRISFEDENYRAIRESIQSSIRYAHHMNWVKLNLATISNERMPSKLKTAIDKIEDPKLRQELNGIRRDMALIYLGLMIARSPLLLLFLAIIIPSIFLMARFKSKELGNIADTAQREAEVGDALAA